MVCSSQNCLFLNFCCVDRESTIPSDDVIASKEQADRAEYREMLQSVTAPTKEVNGFAPVLSKEVTTTTTFVPEKAELEEGFLSRLGNLLSYSVPSDDKGSSSKEASPVIASGSDEDLKGRYYFGKFQFTPYDAEKHLALRKAYIEGLVWNLKYYYEGCVSWEWYYPYHYGKYQNCSFPVMVSVGFIYYIFTIVRSLTIVALRQPMCYRTNA